LNGRAVLASTSAKLGRGSVSADRRKPRRAEGCSTVKRHVPNDGRKTMRTLAVVSAAALLGLGSFADDAQAQFRRSRGGAIAAGVIGGLAAGALLGAATSAYAAPGYSYYGYAPAYSYGYAPSYSYGYAPAYSYDYAYAPTYGYNYGYAPAYVPRRTYRTRRVVRRHYAPRYAYAPAYSYGGPNISVGFGFGSPGYRYWGY
jgi:hypothetical protein